MKRKILPVILSFGVIIMLIIYPDKYLSSALDGLKLFAVSVLPALLPFFFFTKILSGLGVGDALGKMLSSPCRKLYGTSGIGGYVLIMSMLSGYPVGAKLLSDLVKNKSLSRSDARSIASFTSTSGPLFIVGSVGAIMLRSKSSGYVVLICHYLSAVINGLLYRKRKQIVDVDQVAKSQKVDYILSESVYSAVISVLIAGAYVSIFYTCAVMLVDLGVVGVLSNALNYLIQSEAISQGVAFGLVEMTGGCLMLSKCSGSLVLPAICAVISFGGLSVTLQSMTFLEECEVKPLRYLLTKLTQSAIAFLLCYVATIFFCL